jgi:hypothetical protein
MADDAVLLKDGQNVLIERDGFYGPEEVEDERAAV